MNAGVGRDGYEARAGDLAELFARAPFEEGGWERALKTLASRTGSSPDDHKKAPIVGRSNEGKPGTRKTRYGKMQRKWGK